MKFGRSAALVLSGVMLVISGVCAQEAGDPPLRDADALLQAGKPADAYTLLEPLEFARAGELRFDYLLGIAALDSGKPDKATLAFERVLAVDPNFAGARLDMARAYYQLGDLPRAKTEFELVLKQSPPEAARVTIQKYMDAIAAYEQSQRTQVSGYAEGVVGRDSNIANSTTQTFTFASNSIWSGLFPSNQLPPSSTLAGNYEGVNAGMAIHHRLNTRWGVFGNADLHQHGNTTHTAYDSTAVDAQVGLSLQDGNSGYKLSLTGGQTDSGGTMHRNAQGLAGVWQYAPSPSQQFSAFGQWSQNRASGYPATSPSTDARIEGDTDQLVLGAGGVHLFSDTPGALFGSIFIGQEKDVAPVISAGLPNGGRVDGRKDFAGLRLGMQTRLSGTWDGTVSLGWQSAKYANVNPMTLDNRSETQTDLSLGLAWHLNKDWTLKPQVSFTHKDSNIALYSFDRTDLSVTLRRDFQ